MTYAEFRASQAYRERVSGSHILVKFQHESDPNRLLVGAATSISFSESREAIPAEEMGQLVPSEIIEGRNDLSLSVSAFWTPEWNDRIPSTNELGGSWVIQEIMADEREGAGTVLGVYVGCKIRTVSASQSGRGSRTADLGFIAIKRYTGQQWANLTNAGGA